MADLGETGIEVGIQNISKTGAGAFTGEVTSEMAAEAGFGWTLVGHSDAVQSMAKQMQTLLPRFEKRWLPGFGSSCALEKP